MQEKKFCVCVCYCEGGANKYLPTCTAVVPPSLIMSAIYQMKIKIERRGGQVAMVA